MFPAARVRRASFLPREVRTSAATVMSFLKFASPVSGLRSPIRRSDRPGGLSYWLTWVRRPVKPELHKQRTHRSLLVDRPYGIRHQLRDRQRLDPARFLPRLGKRDRIRNHHFLPVSYTHLTLPTTREVKV